MYRQGCYLRVFFHTIFEKQFRRPIVELVDPHPPIQCCHYQANFQLAWKFQEYFHTDRFKYILEGKSTKFYRKRALTSTIVAANLDKPHHAKMDLNKKFRPMKKTIQTFKLDAQGFQKTMFENPPTQKFFWHCPHPGLNQGPLDLRSNALPT